MTGLWAGDALKGRVAVVNGAGSGIGRAIAGALAAAGADLMLSDLAEASAAQTAQGIGRGDLRVEVMASDVRAPAAMEALFARAEDRLGRVDVAISAAGIGGPAALAHEIASADWDAVIATNLTGAFLFAAAAARRMVAQKAGSITLVTSQVSEVAQRNCAAYVASKGGAKMLVKAMALDLAPYGVRVNALAPGFTDTPMTRGGDPGHADSRRQSLAHIPMGRMGRPEEIAAAAVFLASDAATYITGTTVFVDGGYLTV
ncbi:MAG: SDR family oxidoreductase [Rhodobacteraceae bacterium]|nr:SDR family oxidoreductase [Paracoccaceae bacterium]